MTEPVVGRANVLCDLHRLGFGSDVGVAEKAGPDRRLIIPDEGRDGLRAQVVAFDQVVSSIPDQMLKHPFDYRPHAICCFEIVIVWMNPERRCTEMEAHLQGVQ